MLNDIGAIKMNVFDERAAIIAVKDDMLFFTGRAAPLHYDANGIGRTLRRVRYIWWNKKRFTFVNDVVDDAVPFPDPHFDVAFQLVKVLFRVDLMKIVTCVWSGDDHDKKIAAIIKITIADWWLELISIFFDPMAEVNRRQDNGSATARRM